MTLTTISILIATIVYVAYNAFSLAYFKVPHSLSETYYLWKERSNKGFLFPCMMYVVVACMMPAWIGMSEGSNFQFLAFLAPASLAFVATAPAFKSSDLENNVHTISAYIAAACSLAWVGIVTPYWWVILIWLGIISGILTITKTYSCIVYWLETIAIGATFTSTIIYSI